MSYLTIFSTKCRTRRNVAYTKSRMRPIVAGPRSAVGNVSGYRCVSDLISKFQVGLKSILRQGLSEPDFYGDLVYELKKIVGSNNFLAQFIKIISHYKKIGYNINLLQQTACLVVNPITVGNFAFLFNCTLVGRTSDSMMVPT